MKFIVCVPELHYAQYVVEASENQDAITIVRHELLHGEKSQQKLSLAKYFIV